LRVELTLKGKELKEIKQNTPRANPNPIPEEATRFNSH
jgi:hypothetical protein